MKRLVLVTPFDRGITRLSQAEQLELMQTCALCLITQDLANNSTRLKPEWKTCKSELGVPVEACTIDVADPRVREAIMFRAPAVCAEAEDGSLVGVLDQSELARCKGSVADFRSRLSFRLMAIGLALPKNSPGSNKGRSK